MSRTRIFSCILACTIPCIHRRPLEFNTTSKWHKPGVSRHVLAIERVLQRTLAVAHMHWTKSGFLKGWKIKRKRVLCARRGCKLWPWKGCIFKLINFSDFATLANIPYVQEPGSWMKNLDIARGPPFSQAFVGSGTYIYIYWMVIYIHLAWCVAAWLSWSRKQILREHLRLHHTSQSKKLSFWQHLSHPFVKARESGHLTKSVALIFCQG